MFLAGMIIGAALGVLLIRLHKLLNEMDADAQRFKEDVKATCEFWRRNEKRIIDIFKRELLLQVVLFFFVLAEKTDCIMRNIQ